MNIHSIKLTTSQKQLLIRVLTSPTPELAKAETEFGEKNIAAGELLSNLGIIDLNDSTATVTDDGKELMRKQGLIDDSDQLTAEAEKYKAGDGNVNDGTDLGDEGGDQPNDFGDEDFGGVFDKDQSEDGMTDDMSGLDDIPPPEDDIKQESLLFTINKLV